MSISRKESLKIYKCGSDIFEIEAICELPKIKFFDKVLLIDKIKDRKHQNGFKTLLGTVLTKISILCCIKGEIDQIIKNDLINMLTTTYGGISLEEIYKAFELERYGVYDTISEHFQQFNAEYVLGVLKKYKEWKVKEKQLLNYSPTKENNQVTEDEKSKIRNEFLETVFEKLTDDDFYDGAWLLYEELETEGKIKISIEEKKTLYKEELSKYKAQKNSRNKR